ncbi:hypothetical protein NDU88_002294 [Pleurodeles waltl]|uniref:Uncharacterized protein n=1 Tax=Pleurodeles waltl TaxID=8319 RepID=A0AAV7SCI7_PLEWA|nr:hypothetical protein NDU88_002294 [Pleurodeles waltl]
MNASECSGGAQAGRFRPERRNRKPRAPAATGSARLPVVALWPEPSGLGPTRALTRIHAGTPAQLGHPP